MLEMITILFADVRVIRMNRASMTLEYKGSTLLATKKVFNQLAIDGKLEMAFIMPYPGKFGGTTANWIAIPSIF